MVKEVKNCGIKDDPAGLRREERQVQSVRLTTRNKPTVKSKQLSYFNLTFIDYFIM